MRHLDINGVDKVTGEKFAGYIPRDLDVGDQFDKFDRSYTIITQEVAEKTYDENGALSIRCVQVGG